MCHWLNTTLAGLIVHAVTGRTLNTLHNCSKCVAAPTRDPHGGGACGVNMLQGYPTAYCLWSLGSTGSGTWIVIAAQTYLNLLQTGV